MNETIILGEKLPGKDYKDRTGAYLIAFEGERFAAVKTPKGFFLPGGGIEQDETDDSCIKRECLEELGYEVQIHDFILAAEEYTLHEKIGYFHPIQHYYTGTLSKKVKDKTELDHELVLLEISEAESKMHIRIQGMAVEYANKKRTSR